jgi:hypothetical protein
MTGHWHPVPPAAVDADVMARSVDVVVVLGVAPATDRADGHALPAVPTNREPRALIGTASTADAPASSAANDHDHQHVSAHEHERESVQVDQKEL